MSDRKRYALIGTGSRSAMFSRAVLDTYRDRAELVAYCDPNQTRMDYWNRQYRETLQAEPVPTYKPERFEEMIARTRPDVVIVTSIDRTHHRYLCGAMELGCDVITEKPMTVDAQKCQRVLDTQHRTGRELTVTFNYRYAPRNSRVKELLMQGVIGNVLSVHFEWLLDTKHGADYFRRWHRDKRNSGGLMVHKATHHFDLVNWWIDSSPRTVFAMGDLRFYGKENAERRGVTAFYSRARGSEVARNDPFALDLVGRGKELKGLYADAEHEDQYYRDQSVFGDGISIEDDMAVMVRYASRAVMSYHLTAYSPWEGYRVCFNGDAGRLEYECIETPYVSAGDGDHNFAKNVLGAAPYEVVEPTSILLHRHWSKPVKVDVTEKSEGGHGGADSRLLKDLFDPPGAGGDPLGRAAGHRDGAMSILTGIAANQSMATGLPVDVRALVAFPG